MERISTPQQVFEHDEGIILRTAEPTDGQLISDYFIANREHLKQWEAQTGRGFLLRVWLDTAFD